MLSVLSYMNESGILYRDLKPENLVLDAMGYLKLVDFGLAKKLMPSERTYTMCGTPDYLAPELISGGGYGRSCDLWSFGILLFELVTRRTPFFDENQSQMMNKIINSDQFLSGAFPKSLDASLKDLIKKFLDPNPAMRMGNLEHGVTEIWEHSWFAELRRDVIEQRALNPPYTPPVSRTGVPAWIYLLGLDLTHVLVHMLLLMTDATTGAPRPLRRAATNSAPNQCRSLAEVHICSTLSIWTSAPPRTPRIEASSSYGVCVCICVTGVNPWIYVLRRIAPGPYATTNRGGGGWNSTCV